MWVIIRRRWAACWIFPKKCPNWLLGHWPIRWAIPCLRIGRPKTGCCLAVATLRKQHITPRLRAERRLPAADQAVRPDQVVVATSTH